MTSDDTTRPRFRVRETAEFPIPGPATDGTVTAAVAAAKDWASRHPTRGAVVGGEMTISIAPDPHGGPGDLVLSVELRDEHYPHRPRIDASTVRGADAGEHAAGSDPFPPHLLPGEQVSRSAVHPTGDAGGPSRTRDA